MMQTLLIAVGVYSFFKLCQHAFWLMFRLMQIFLKSLWEVVQEGNTIHLIFYVFVMSIVHFAHGHADDLWEAWELLQQNASKGV